MKHSSTHGSVAAALAGGGIRPTPAQMAALKRDLERRAAELEATGQLATVASSTGKDGDNIPEIFPESGEAQPEPSEQSP